jgi:AcrR family transcriptional regulator
MRKKSYGDNETQHVIMRATYRALCKHGYADLTMQKIADEFDKTKATLHYHYDTKENLLAAFFEYLFNKFKQQNNISDLESPKEKLNGFIDRLLLGSPERRRNDQFDHWEFHMVLLAIRMQSIHTDEIRGQLTDNFNTLRAMISGIVRDGVEQGTFRDVDPDQIALLILTVINGTHVYHLTLDRDDIAETTRHALHAFIETWLCRPTDHPEETSYCENNADPKNSLK